MTWLFPFEPLHAALCYESHTLVFVKSTAGKQLLPSLQFSDKRKKAGLKPSNHVTQMASWLFPLSSWNA